MTWKLWTFTVIMIIEGLISIGRIGREAKSKTATDAVYQIVELGFLTWLVLS